MKRILFATLALALAGSAGGANAQTVVTGNVTTNTTWGSGANPSPIILDGVIFVKGATLTILPGTIVRGQPRSAAVVAGQTAGSPGALVVTQTGRIVANGSAANPVIMTTAAIDNNNDGIADVGPGGFEARWTPGATFLDEDPLNAPLAPLNKAGVSNVGLWGGLVVLGNAPTNNANRAGVGYGKALIEGLTIPGFPASDATYGGVLPHDNSGSLRFVSIRHAGDEIGNGNELNGLSLGGVGSGTVLENIEIYANFDDGFEWFGGTVNGKNLAVFFVGDDMFDLDEGYTGINQFLFGIAPFFKQNDGAPYGSASGDKGGEFDGDNFRPDAVALQNNVNTRIDITGSVVDATPWPLSNPAMYNMTLIGSTPDPGQEFTPAFAAGTKRGIQFRNGFAGAVFNSIVVNTGGETGIEVDTDIGDGAPGFDALDNANNGLISLVCSTLANGAPLAAAEQTVVANGNALNAEFGGTAAGNNVVNGAFNGLLKEDQTFDPTGNAQGKLVSSLKSSPINPRPAAGLAGIGNCVAPSGPGLERANFRGAFLRTAPRLWTTGWTTLNRAGLLAN